MQCTCKSERSKNKSTTTRAAQEHQGLPSTKYRQAPAAKVRLIPITPKVKGPPVKRSDHVRIVVSSTVRILRLDVRWMVGSVGFEHLHTPLDSDLNKHRNEIQTPHVNNKTKEKYTYWIVILFDSSSDYK